MGTLRDDLAGATPGPWSVSGSTIRYAGDREVLAQHDTISREASLLRVNTTGRYGTWGQDARAIVSVMNAAPALLDVVEAARAIFGTNPGSDGEEVALSNLDAALDRLAAIEEKP